MLVIARALPSSFFKAMTAKVAAKYHARIDERLIPAWRRDEGEDVAACVTALARGQFAHATGTVINADGG